MPMSQHRPALAAILVAVVAVLFAVAAVPAMAAPASIPPSNPAIAQDAARYDGTYQGQCWTFVKKVVAEVTGRQIGFDYREGFFDAGAIEVSLTDAGPGDIIQIANDADTSPGADYAGLHTAIVVSANGDGTFTVVDSNMNFDGVVHIRENYNPVASAGRYGGLTYHIYRISGSGTGPSPAGAGVTNRVPSARLVPVDAASVAVGDTLFTNTPGDVLRLRTAPNGDILTVLGDRTQVTVIANAGLANGYHWVQVSTPAGQGFVAIEFIAKSTATGTNTTPAATPSPTPASTSNGGGTAGARSSGSGTVNPVLPFRRVVPGVTADE